MPPSRDPDDEVVGFEGHVGPGGSFSARAVTRGELARRPGCGAVLVTALVLALVATCALADDGPRIFGLPAWATPGFLLALGFNTGVGLVIAGLAGRVVGAPRAGCAAVVLLLAAGHCAWGVHAGREVLSWPMVGAAVAALAVFGAAHAAWRAARGTPEPRPGARAGTRAAAPSRRP